MTSIPRPIRTDRDVRLERHFSLLRWPLGLLFVSLALSFATPMASAEAPAPTTATDAEARANYEAGVVAYNDGRVADALGYFQRSYALSQRPALLFNIATTHERLRHDAEAIAAYRAYLERVPDAENRRFVEERIAFLESSTAGAPRPAPIAETTAEPTAPTPEEAARAVDLGGASSSSGHDEPAHRPLVKRWWFWTVIGAVVVGGAVTASLLLTRGDAGTEAPLPGDVGPGGVVVTRLGR